MKTAPTIRTAAALNRHAESVRARRHDLTCRFIEQGRGTLTPSQIENHVRAGTADADEREAFALSSEAEQIRLYVARNFGPGAFRYLDWGVVPAKTTLPERYEPSAFFRRALVYTSGASVADAIAGTWSPTSPVRVSA